MLEHALKYASMGWHVLPCHSIIETNHGRVCTCKNIGCHSPGKHPTTYDGLKSATCDPETIKVWWQKWPHANVAILTGAPSGVVALDIDPKNDGSNSLDDLIEKHEPLPDTVTAITGSGGQHYLFQHPGFHIKNSASQIAPGIDIRGDGGYIIVSPSQHISGNRYEWEASSEPGMVPIAPIPPFLITLIRDADKKIFKSKPTISAGKPVPEGQRNAYLASCAGTIVRKGMTPEAVNAAIHTENEYRCQPPLETDEVNKILKSIENYRQQGE